MMDFRMQWVVLWVRCLIRRLRCRLRGYHVPLHGSVTSEWCVTCGLVLWARIRDGSPYPDWLSGPRAPAGWRRRPRRRPAADGRPQMPAFRPHQPSRVDYPEEW